MAWVAAGGFCAKMFVGAGLFCATGVGFLFKKPSSSSSSKRFFFFCWTGACFGIPCKGGGLFTGTLYDLWIFFCGEFCGIEGLTL